MIYDSNSLQLSGASHRFSEALRDREALLDARRDTVTHRATRIIVKFNMHYFKFVQHNNTVSTNLHKNE